jgi:hypothetical protein
VSVRGVESEVSFDFVSHGSTNVELVDQTFTLT